MSKSDPLPHEAILLSRAISEKSTLSITFLDGDVVVSEVRWHTSDAIGLRDGKIVSRSAIKFWQIIEL